jgi:hypothetical protein
VFISATVGNTRQAKGSAPYFESPVIEPGFLHFGDWMKDHYTLELSGHQARGLNVALELVKQLMAVERTRPSIRTL